MIGLWIVLVWGAAVPAHATTVLYLSAEHQAELSTAIVEATVGAKDTIALQDGRIYTDTTLLVTGLINGSAPDVLNIRQRGGEHAGQRTVLPGDARLSTGDKIVAMIRQVEGRWYLTALAQSVWHIEGEGPNAQVARDLEGLALQQDTLNGTKPVLLTPLEFTTLASLRRTLASTPTATP